MASIEESSEHYGPVLWDEPATPRNFIKYAEVEIQVIGTPGTAYQLQRSFDGENFSDYQPRDVLFERYATITAAGFYVVEGGAFIKFSAGEGATIQVRAEA